MICYVVIVISILNQFEPAHFLLEWAIFAENSMSEETKKVFHPLRLKKKGDIYTKKYNFFRQKYNIPFAYHLLTISLAIDKQRIILVKEILTI